jgi:hypothetical protein
MASIFDDELDTNEAKAARKFRKQSQGLHTSSKGALERRAAQGAQAFQEETGQPIEILQRGESNALEEQVLGNQIAEQELVREAAEIDQKKTAVEIAKTPEGKQIIERSIEEAPMSDRAKKDLKRSDFAEEVRQGHLRQKAGAPVSPKQNFMSTMALFLPTIIGGIAGGLLEGTEGAVGGLEGGMAGSKAGLDLIEQSEGLETEALKQEKLRAEIEGIGKPDADKQRRLEISEGNLEQRKEEIRLQKKRLVNTEIERDVREEDRNIDRAIKAKENFKSRSDVDSLIKSRENLNDIEDILNDAPEIASGVIGFKIAKGIAKEVGNLTSEERKAAQISPSFLRNIERAGTKFLMGKLPESDVIELRKVVKAMRKSTNGRMEGIIGGFTKSRSRAFKGETRRMFEEDLRNEFLSPENPESKKRKRMEELRAKKARK